jgi:hypothetical protein
MSNSVSRLTCENVLVSDHATVVDGQTGHCHQKDEGSGCKHPCGVARVETSRLVSAQRKVRVAVGVRIVSVEKFCHSSGGSL